MQKIAFSFFTLFMLNTTMQAQKIKYPVTATIPQTDNYFGTKIEDPYRWLENDTAKNTEAWVQEQNAVTQSYLEKIPFRNKIKDRLTELWNYPKYSAPQQEGKYFIVAKNDGLQNQFVLFIQQGLNGVPEVLLDPNRLSTDGTVALQATSMSKNQKYFGYATSASGSDWQEIYVLDVATKKLLVDKLEYVKFSGISWLGDEGFYYSAYSKPENELTKFSVKTEYQKVFYHKLGTAQKDDKLIYEDKDHPLRYVGAGLTEDDRFLILYIGEGTDGSEIKIKDLTDKKATGFTTIVPGFKTNASVVTNVGDKILLVTNNEAPNKKVVLLDPKNPAPENWVTIIAEKEEPLTDISTGGGNLFASYLKDASTEVQQYSMDGKLEHSIKLPGVGTASGFGSKAEEDFFFYTFTSFTYPATSFRYDIKTGTSTLYQKSEVKFNPEDFVTKQVFYTSKDGTKVPMFIVHKKGIVLNGENPTCLYAYGGFNINLTPGFALTNLPFLENGGIYCVANLRGGAEYGEDWHRAGMLEKKQNVFDDFIAAAEYLIKEKYTNPKKYLLQNPPGFD